MMLCDLYIHTVYASIIYEPAYMVGIYVYGNTSDLQCHFTTRRFHCTACIIVIIISLASYRHTNHLLGQTYCTIYRLWYWWCCVNICCRKCLSCVFSMYILMYDVVISLCATFKVQRIDIEANLCKVLHHQTRNKLCISKLCFVYTVP